MAKSQVTFSKREKEKLRQKKREEKQQKREERKSESSKKSFEDMIAYVDENGQISDTPPDPNQKKKVVAEDIQVSVLRQPEPDPSEAFRTGKVIYFNTDKNYGFIRDSLTQESLFVHGSSLSQAVNDGDPVSFEVERTPKGLSAVRVTPKTVPNT